MSQEEFVRHLLGAGDAIVEREIEHLDFTPENNKTN